MTLPIGGFRSVSDGFQPVLSSRVKRSIRNAQGSSRRFCTIRSEALSTQLLSSVASVALRLVLRKCGSVNINVDSNNIFALLSGSVDGVSVQGTDWQTPKNLTCRKVSVRTLGTFGIDIPAILSGKIALQKESPASVDITLDAADLNNFLANPVMKDQVAALGRGDLPITSVRVESISPSSRSVLVSCTTLGRTYRLSVGPGQSSIPALVKASEGVEYDGNVQEVCVRLQGWLNSLVVDFAGTLCCMQKFQVIGPSLTVTAGATICKYPSQALTDFQF